MLPPAIQRLAVTDVYPAAVQAGVFFRIMGWIYRVFEAPGAAFPSSHVAVALCTVVFLIPLPPAHPLCPSGGRPPALPSTVYCRYHYVVDVLAGLFTAAVLIPLGNWLYFRYQQREQGES